MDTRPTYTFTHHQQQLIGHALHEYAALWSGSWKGPYGVASDGLSNLLEDALDICEITQLPHARLSGHAITVRYLRILLEGIFDPDVLPALQILPDPSVGNSEAAHHPAKNTPTMYPVGK